jgi:hypothetical protein
MPFSKIDPLRFNLDAVKTMQTAFDAVCLEMKLEVNDPRRSELATLIIRLAHDGYMEKLKERAGEAMKQSARMRDMVRLDVPSGSHADISTATVNGANRQHPKHG